MDKFYVHHIDLTPTLKGLSVAFTHVVITKGDDVDFVSSVDNVEISHVKSREIEDEAELVVLCKYMYGVTEADEAGRIEVFGMDIE